MSNKLSAWIKRLMASVGLNQGPVAPDFISGHPSTWHQRYTKLVEACLAACIYELKLAEKEERDPAIPHEDVEYLLDEFNSTREVIRAMVHEGAKSHDIEDRCANVWRETISILRKLPDPVKIRRQRK